VRLTRPEILDNVLIILLGHAAGNFAAAALSFRDEVLVPLFR